MAGFIAILPIRFGDKWLQPGDPVPMERGRNYGSMVRLGQIAEVRDGALLLDRNYRLTARRDTLPLVDLKFIDHALSITRPRAEPFMGRKSARG